VDRSGDPTAAAAISGPDQLMFNDRIYTLQTKRHVHPMFVNR
jgi:hypothetical protein